MQLLAVFVPCQLVRFGIRLNVAFEVDVIALIYVVCLQAQAQLDRHYWCIWEFYAR